MKLWGGRFSQDSAKSAQALSRSVHFDYRLAKYDIAVNLNHVLTLEQTSIISKADSKKLQDALKKIGDEVNSQKFEILESDEDIHSAIERRLVELLPDIGSVIRTGRSRNDLVATDFKLYLLESFHHIAVNICALINVINEQALSQVKTIAPGFTHTQHAQPISFGQELSKHSEALTRDLTRINDWLTRNSISPFGAAALAGSRFNPNPDAVAKNLGFSSAMNNSIDAVSDRDFAAEALFVFAMISIHLSRFAEEVILWSSSEFKWVEVSDAYSTGSSIMPQKKNADIAELVRGKTGRFVGNLTALLTTIKAMPFAYNRDLQEDKEPIFDSVDQLTLIIDAMVGMTSELKFNVANIQKNVTQDFSLATEIADYLVNKKIPFSKAHHISGQIVAYCEKNKKDLTALTISELKNFSADFEEDIFGQLNAQTAVSVRNSRMGTNPDSVAKAIAANQLEIADLSRKFSDQMQALSGKLSW